MSRAPGFAFEIANSVSRGETSASGIVEDALSRIDARDRDVGAFTDVVAERARRKAAIIDADRAAGRAIGPLAGVPFAVKNLFDVEGLPTRAGSKINRERSPAARDGALVRKLEGAGAILLGALNMGEYAYDFTGENAHDGPSRNPHDLTRMSGGSSGGSAAAVAAGFAPLSLASDTNGSIRVPSSFCGLFGLKPTYGRLSRAGTFPFVDSLDHLGPIARCVKDLALSYDAMQGADADDPACQPPGHAPTLREIELGANGLRVAIADDYFARGGFPEAFAAVERVANALNATRRVVFPEAARARAAAYLITASEGGALHRRTLAARAADYDPDTRCRLMAGAMIPTAWINDAQRFRRWFHDRALEIFRDVDIVIAPATPFSAPKLGQKSFMLDGSEIPLRANIGVFTQPISFVGLPVVAAPAAASGEAPIGVQIIAAPWREDLALRAAFELERTGVSRAPVAASFA
ncbi:AtzE family amidohydrolase [Terrarubrum flagellatum]|uniref:AtzE family amidohydrolase n=1 Tax=Terrirubrum flagellatum TaxID=2895980 RepID=UPI0031450768